jgi:peptide/nickel transport system substrate-binding protein
MDHRTRAFSLAAILLVMLAACAPASPASAPPRAQAPGEQAPAPAQPAARKSITFGITGNIRSFSLSEVGSGGAGRALTELWIQGLVTSGMKTQAPEARIAAEVPSVDRGTMRVEPDGTMTVTWKIRPDVKWADGTPLTSQDFLFGYRVATEQGTPFPSGTLGRELDAITAPDDQTLIMVWKRPYYLANAIGSPVAGLQPLPRHVLETEFDAKVPERFQNLPYWTTEFFHVGPFRPVRINPGSEIVLEAVPQYFLGRPKVDTLIVKMYGDENTLYAGLTSGQMDITGYLSDEQGYELKEMWDRSGQGKVYEGVGTTSGVFFQFAPELQSEPSLLDRRVRQALAYAIDRESWTEAVMGRKTNLVADGLLPFTHHLYSSTKGTLSQYRYDPQLAGRMLAEAGWTRGGDGFVTHSSDGRRFKVLVWSTTGTRQSKETAILADQWKAVGLETSIYLMPDALQEDRQHWSSYPNLEITPRGYGDTVLTRMECAESTVGPTFRGANRGHYCNAAEMDPLIASYRSSLSLDDQGRFMRQIAELSAQDLPVIQTYFRPFLPAVVKGVTALADDFGGALEAGGRYGSYYRNGHLWDRV